MEMKNPNHPGDIIRACLDELGVNMTDGAKALGVTRAALSRVLNRKAAVSAEMAVRLEKAIGSSASFWLRLQLNYDLAQVQARRGKIRVRRLGSAAHLASRITIYAADLTWAEPTEFSRHRLRKKRLPDGAIQPVHVITDINLSFYP